MKKTISHSYYLLSLLLVALMLFASCSNTKHIAEGDSLYIGARVSIKDNNAESKERKIIKNDLEGAVRPKPNSKFLGMRIKLTIYNLAGNPSKEKGIRKWLRKNGEPPVLASTLNTSRNEKVLANRLENAGFFYSGINSHTETKRKKTKAYFDVITGPQYKVRKVYFPNDSTAISANIAATASKTLLKTGVPYNLSLIKGERDRIAKELTEKGYYYFKSDYIIVVADTSVGNFEMDLHIKPKYDEMPPEAENIYTISNIYVYPNYRLEKDSSADTKKNAVYHKGYYVIDRQKLFRPVVFEQAMQFQPDETYNRTEQNLSLSRLVSLGVFKFVKNHFDPIDNGQSPKLDAYYYLTPYPKKSLYFEVGAESQSDSKLGALAKVSWRNRNALKGAELFTIGLHGGYEFQSGGNVQRPGGFEGGGEISLAIPRFIVPFFTILPSNAYVPHTTIRAAYDLSVRQNLYRIHSVKGSLGYVFKEDIRKEHQLFPININYVKTDTLQSGVQANVNYSNIIFNGLIIGPTYEYTYNSQAAGFKADNYYFNGLIDFSGNILGLAQGASQDNPKRIFDAQYAQYMKYQVDGRYYKHFGINKNNIWASRLFFGVGFPNGNSRQLPNIKQFFSGGASSLRGFPSRLVGPGTFNEDYLYHTRDYIETLGDIKLEVSSELRFNIYQFVNAGVFVDAGNIWTYYKDARFPGGQFSSNFYKELAFDAGAGVRLDFQIVLLRLDVAMPFRKPWLPEGQRWGFDRKDSPVFNLAIGYPF